MSPSQQYFSHFSFSLDGGIIYGCVAEKSCNLFLYKKKEANRNVLKATDREILQDHNFFCFASFVKLK
jgi:hypothetical protein